MIDFQLVWAAVEVDLAAALEELSCGLGEVSPLGEACEIETGTVAGVVPVTVGELLELALAADLANLEEVGEPIPVTD